MNTTHDQQQNDVAPVMGASLLSPSLFTLHGPDGDASPGEAS